jgi:RNA polymerase sigma-70 factor (ECF subfamily)
MDIGRTKRRTFETICDTYSKDLQRFIYTLTRKDPFAMEEIFQNTMEEALKGLKYLRDESKMKSWIFSIAKTEARRYYAANRKFYNNEFIELDEDTFSIQDNEDFTELIANSYLLKSLVNEISEDEQQIFILHYYFDLPLIEISEILHINYNNIKSMHRRGINKMKKKCFL